MHFNNIACTFMKIQNVLLSAIYFVSSKINAEKSIFNYRLLCMHIYTKTSNTAVLSTLYCHRKWNAVLKIQKTEISNDLNDLL